jgi:hypothetical protein
LGKLGVSKGGKRVGDGRANAPPPPIFFLPKNSFFGYRVDKAQVKIQKYFQKNYLGGATE